MTGSGTTRSPRQRSVDDALALLGLAAFGVGAVELAIVRHQGGGPFWPEALFVAAGWIYIASGLIAWHRRPSNRSGMLMIAAGLSWLAANLSTIAVPSVAGAGEVVATVPLAFVVHLVLAVPAGRLTTRASRVAVATGYVVSTLLQLPQLLFHRPDVLAVADRPDVVRVAADVQHGAGFVVTFTAAVILIQRLRLADALQRRVLAPLYAYGVLAVPMVSILANVIGPFFQIPQVYVGALQVGELAGIPIAFCLGLLLGGFARTGELEELAAVLGDAGGPRSALADALAQTLGDPTVAVLFWLPARGSYVDSAGMNASLPGPLTGRSHVEIDVAGHRVGAIAYDATLIADPDLVRTAARIVAIALDRERLTVELLASEEALRTSRERLVEAADRERRSIARNLHDGLQVRLVVLAIEAQELASNTTDPNVRVAGTALRVGIDAAAADVRALVHTVMPAALLERGLCAAAEDLVDRMPLPTRLHLADIDAPLGRAAQSAAYFVLAEGLANALKHSRASELEVRLGRSDDRLRVEVNDDGIGGALCSGNGLRGLADRVDAVGGTMSVLSPPGRGTRVVAEIPCGW